jgi:ribosome-binding protein aMBF1 (putative translation factor)
MITNERQYRITKAALKKFEDSAAAHEQRDPYPDVHPRIHRAAGEALRSEAEELRRQLQEYERLRAGRVKQRTLDSLNELPKAIIEARIAARITQKGLAARLGVAEQQVQRWEASEYAGVSMERLQQVADALGATITERVRFPPSAQVGTSKTRASTRRARTPRRSSRAT